MVAHYFEIHDEDLPCCLRRPTANHRPFEQLSQEDQMLQLRRMHESAPDTKEIAGATLSWNQVGIPKAAALALLQGQPDGVFVVRSSETYPGWFATTLFLRVDLAHFCFSLVLSYVLGDEIIHELILEGPPGGSISIDALKAK